MNSFCRYGWRMLALLVAAGCTQRTDSVDPQVLAAHQERLILAEEPDGVLGVLDVREMFTRPQQISAERTEGDESAPDAPSEAITTGDPAPPERVVVVGRIGGVPNPWKGAQPDYPWSAGRAQFVVADAAAAAEVEEHGHGHGHAHGHAHDDPHHDCPFCAQSANSDVVAVVRFKDAAGNIIPIDARQLFDLKGEETVVVQGKPLILGEAKDGVLVVEADALYIRR